MTVGEAFVAWLPIAAAIAFSPPSIIAIVMVLTTPRAGVNSLSFVVGWLVGLLVVGLVVLLVIGPTRDSDAPVPMWHYWLKSVIGLALIVLAVRYVRSRPRGDEQPKTPGWVDRLDAMNVRGAALLGGAFIVVNPKNLLLAVAGGIAIVDLVDDRLDQALTYLAFMAVATLGVAVPIAVYFGWRERAPDLLSQLRGWMSRHNAVIMAAVCLVLGLLFVVDATTGLVG